LHVRRGAGVVEQLRFASDASQPALGLSDDVVYTASESSMTAQDLLLLYSDGLYRVAGPQGEEFGQERLVEAVRRRENLPTEKLFDDLLEEVHSFAQSREFGDDICLVGLQVERLLHAVSPTR